MSGNRKFSGNQPAWFILLQVIKRYIPYHDRHWAVNEEDPEIARRYSWAELVSAEPQRPQLMISHWWGGRFSDFMTAVDRLVEDRQDETGRGAMSSIATRLLPKRQKTFCCPLSIQLENELCKRRAFENIRKIIYNLCFPKSDSIYYLTCDILGLNFPTTCGTVAY